MQSRNQSLFGNSVVFFSLLAIFFMYPAEVTTFPNAINYLIPKPSKLWYGIYNNGLATSYINVIEILFFFIIMGFFANRLISGNISLKMDRVLLVGLLFYFVSILSLIYNYNIYYFEQLDVFPFDGVLNFGKAFIVYSILLQLADKEFLRILLKVLIHIGVALALVSIIAFFVFGYFTFSERYLGWRVNVLGMGVNTGGTFLSCIALIAYQFKGKNKIYLLSFYIILIAVLLTGSRSALLSLIISLSFYHLIFTKENKKIVIKIFGWSSVIFIVIFFVTSSGVLTMFYNLTGFTIFIRLESLWRFDQDVSAFSRIFIWLNYLEIFTKHLFFGMGNSDWLIEIISRPYGYPHPVPHSHNIIIQTLLKGGIFATLPLLWIFIQSEWRALMSVKRSLNFVAAIAILPIILGGMIGYGFWNQKLVYLFTILLFFVGFGNKKNIVYNFIVQ